jgi:carboxymethylenebutenolidase
MAFALRRRALLAGSVAAGFALAVRPVASATIVTGADGLDEGDVSIPAGDREIPGYRAKPAGKDGLPVAIVVQEIFGVHEHVRDVCRRFAKEGWLAVAPDLYVRQGDPAALAEISEILEIVKRVPDEQVMRDLDATVEWAGKNGGDAKRVGVTGFCWGGRIVWLWCAASTKPKAGVAWYGRLVGDATPLQPKHPVDVAGELRAPVLGLYGGEDAGIPLDGVERMRAALGEESPSEIVVYEGAPHGFHADYRPSYRERDAKDGWRRTLDWFRRHGAA